jgi:hypothetical protein
MTRNMTKALSLAGLLATLSGCYVTTSSYETRRVVVGPAPVGAIALTRDVTFAAYNGEFDVIDLSTHLQVPVRIRPSHDGQIRITARVAGENALGIDGFMANATHNVFGSRLDVRLGGPAYRCASQTIDGAFYVSGVCLQRVEVSLPPYARTRVFINGLPVENPVYVPAPVVVPRPVPRPVIIVPAPRHPPRHAPPVRVVPRYRR